MGQNLVYAYTNFTAPILLCLAGYLLYLLIAHLHIVDRKVLSPRSADSAKKPIKIPYNFTHGGRGAHLHISHWLYTIDIHHNMVRWLFLTFFVLAAVEKQLPLD